MVNTGIQSTDKNVSAVLPVRHHRLAKCKQIFGCALADAFMTICSFFIFLNIQMGFIIIKDRWRAVYFNNQKNIAFDLKSHWPLHINFTIVASFGFLFWHWPWYLMSFALAPTCLALVREGLVTLGLRSLLTSQRDIANTSDVVEFSKSESTGP